MDEPEWQTRKQSIDTKLCSLNLAWQIRRAQASYVAHSAIEPLS